MNASARGAANWIRRHYPSVTENQIKLQVSIVTSSEGDFASSDDTLVVSDSISTHSINSVAEPPPEPPKIQSNHISSTTDYNTITITQ